MDAGGQRKRGLGGSLDLKEPKEPEPHPGLVSNLPVRERLARLRHLARHHRKGLILTHDNPDPDALAAAVALAHLLHVEGGVECRIAYGGIVGRAENTAMIRELRLPVVPVSRVVFEDYDLIALVDTQPSVCNHSLPPSYWPDVVIDHHPPREESGHVAYADVGHGYGATCSILVEYLREARSTLTPEVATALFYGIKADTRDLGRQTYQIDVDSYLFLLPKVDKQVLSNIEHPSLPARYFQLYNAAIERAKVHQTAVEVDLGEIYSPDMVAEVAERMLSLEGMKWSLAYGSYQKNLFLSIRTNDKRMNAGRLIRQICEDLGGSAGGHGAMAGARVPCPSKATCEKVKRQLVRRFLVEFGVSDFKGLPLLKLSPRA